MASPSFDKAVQHHRAGELDKAVTLYRHALRTSSGAEASKIGQMLAAALHMQGHLEQAEEALRGAVRAEPAPAMGARRALAVLLSSQARMDDAVAAMRDGVEASRGCGPDAEREARLGLAVQLSEARRAHEALEVISALAAEFPDAVPVQYELARLSERLGKTDAARAALERVLTLAPELAEAHLLMARLEAGAGKPEEARARLEKLIETTPDQRRGVVMMELAQVLDRMGVHELAFEMARRGQATNFAALPAARRDGALHERVIADCLKIEAEGVGRWARADIGKDADATPIFVVGFPRSGTTLIEQMLGAHPRLAVTDELPLLQRTREKMFLRFRPRGEYPRDLGEFTADQVAQARKWYLERAASAIGAERMAGKRIVDKQPLNTIDLCFVRLIFPESPVVFVQRDPRDVVLSCFMQGFSRGVPHLFTLEGTARLYDRFMTVWEHYKKVLGLRYVEVRYEDLVREPEREMRRVVEFVGERWDDRVMKSHEGAHRRYVITPSYGDVAQPVYTRAVGRWEKYRVQMGAVMGELEGWVGGE